MDFNYLFPDNREEGEYSLDLIGYTLTESNFSKGKQIKMV